MADERPADHVSDDEEDAAVKQAKPKQHDAGRSDLEGIRDFRDEEVDVGAIDTSALITNNVNAESQVKIKLNKDDIDMIASEMMVSAAVAEKCLRDHKGDVKSALVYLVNC